MANPPRSKLPAYDDEVDEVSDDAATLQASKWAEQMRPRYGKPEHMVGTIVVRRSERQTTFSKLVVPMALLVGAGMVVGGYVAIHGMGLGRSSEPAPAATVAAAPIAAPEPAPVEPAAPQVRLVDVRIDSKPIGATVMLVEHGRTQLIGNTPISASFDVAREYDLVFTYPDQPTQVEHLVPSATTHVMVELGAKPRPVERARVEPARVEPARVERHVEHARPVERPVERAAERPVERAAPSEPAAAKGQGTLMISSKPPCEIIVDGAPTGLTTPQRALALPAGPHKITLVNAEKDLRKTITVQITADATEKVIEDLLP